MRFGILGTLQASTDGETVDLGWPKQRALLAALLLTPNRVVSRADLTVALWGPNPPASATNGLQKYVSALRRVLGPSRVLTRAPGYLIAVEPSELDLLEFEQLAAAERWREALDLWRGEPCEDVELLGPWQAHLDALRERRDDLRGRVIDQRLAAGEHESLIPELKALVHADPLREQHWARLMRAQHRAGRTAQALATYAELRSVLAEELGVDPGGELQTLHQALLTGTEPMAPSTVAGSSGSTWSARCQLPLDVRDFVGRFEAERAIVKQLSEPGSSVIVISGLPGVGKSALAVRVAHRLRSAYPDGQLYARLTGATAARRPEEIVIHLLRSLGVESGAIPDDLDACSAMLRAQLADRRVLLVLDDAADADQVRPLLPGTDTCAVLITSRNALVSLAALDGAIRMPLDVLFTDEAVDLLGRVLPRSRVGFPEEKLAEIALLCGHLPLALRIAGANLALQEAEPVGDFVTALRDGNRLAALAVHGEDRVMVRAAFELSYRALSPPARRAFRLSSLIFGPDFGTSAVAALLNCDDAVARRLLDALVDISLLQRTSRDRYQFHDLLGLYAAEIVDIEESAGDRELARKRLFYYYVNGATAASLILYDSDLSMPLPEHIAEATSPRTFKDRDAAVEWLTAEWFGIAGVIRSRVPGPEVWYLIDALRVYAPSTEHIGSWAELVEIGLESAAAADDPFGQGAMHNCRALLTYFLGRHADALPDMRTAREFYEKAGWVRRSHSAESAYGGMLILVGAIREGRDVLHGCLQNLLTAGDKGSTELIMTRINLGAVAFLMGDLPFAVENSRRVLDILDDQGGREYDRVFCYNQLGCCYHLMGELKLSMETLAASVVLCRRISIRDMEAAALCNQALVLADAGLLQDATAAAESALDISTRSNYDRVRADALMALGHVALKQGDLSGSIDFFETAASIGNDLSSHRTVVVSTIGSARALIRSGLPKDAMERTRRALDVSARLEMRYLRGRAEAVHAAALAGAARWSEAEVQARSAVATLVGTGAAPALDAARDLLAELARRRTAPGRLRGPAFASASAERVTDLP